MPLAFETSPKKIFFKHTHFYSGIRDYSHLPRNIKDLSYDAKRFKRVLKRFFFKHTHFYSLEEYFNLKFDLNFNSQL